MKNWLKKSLATLFAFGAITAPSLASAQFYSSPNDCNPCGDWDASRFFITSSALYWKTCVDHTDYAVTGTGFTNGSANLTNGRTHSVDLGWDWGFKLGLGYEFPCGGWDIRANWVRFHTHDHNNASVPTGGTLQANIMNPAFTPTNGSLSATSARGYAKVNYDTLDILTSRACCVCHDLMIRPYFGARVLWLHRTFHATYAGDVFTGADDGVEWHSKYTAGGLHTGMEMEVDLGCDFYLFGNAAGSLVAGNNDGRQTQTLTTVNEGPVVTTFDIKDDNRCLVSYNYELSLGAIYRTCLCECWNIDWTLAYDFVHWSRVPELVRFTDNESLTNSTGGRNGSVSFHGICFSSVWRF